MRSYKNRKGIIMSAYACVSGGVMFVPEVIEKTMPIMALRRSNDNEASEEE